MIYTGAREWTDDKLCTAQTVAPVRVGQRSLFLFVVGYWTHHKWTHLTLRPNIGLFAISTGLASRTD